MLVTSCMDVFTIAHYGRKLFARRLSKNLQSFVFRMNSPDDYNIIKGYYHNCLKNIFGMFYNLTMVFATYFSYIFTMRLICTNTYPILPSCLILFIFPRFFHNFCCTRYHVFPIPPSNCGSARFIAKFQMRWHRTHFEI